MTNPDEVETDSPLDFDGCSSHSCRRPGIHSLIWGECAHAPESARPPPATWEQDPLQALADLIRANQWTTQTMDDGYPVYPRR